MKGIYNNPTDINSAALNALVENDLTKAQNCFRLNVKKNPCLMTFSNLGVFYVQEGIALKNGRRRNAVKLGLDILKKGESIETSGLNLAAIASAYLEINEFEKSINYYERAIERIPHNYALYNNCGVASYLAKSFEKAVECFSKALSYCQNLKENQEINVSLAYATLAIDKEKCHKIVIEMMDSMPTQGFDVDLFVLLYLCNDFQVAHKMCKELFQSYYLNGPVVAMILDCLLVLGRDAEAIECMHLQIESLKEYDYDVRKEVENAKSAYASLDYRKKLIAEYLYVPPSIKQCYYYGCAEHNPTGASYL